MRVMDTEDDQVADMKIPDDDFTNVTVAIGDTYGDDVFRTNTNGASWWSNLELTQVVPPGG